MWSFVFSSLPQRPMTSNFEGFSIPNFIHYIYFPMLIIKKEPVFSLLNVQCLTRALLVPFLKRLVWRGPWLEIEPGTSRTRSQHYTTSLSRRRCVDMYFKKLIKHKVNTYDKGLNIYIYIHNTAIFFSVLPIGLSCRVYCPYTRLFSIYTAPVWSLTQSTYLIGCI